MFVVVVRLVMVHSNLEKTYKEHKKLAAGFIDLV